MPTQNSPQVQFIQSLDRGLEILQLVARARQPVSLVELAESLGVDRSSALRLAHTLRRRGFLSCPPGRKDYVLGSSIWTLSRQYDWTNMLVKLAQPDLKLLAAEINETAHLAVRDGKNALFIDSAYTRHIVAISGRTGELVPLYCTAHGKALIADADEAILTGILGAGPLETYTRTTIASIEALARECSAIRERGYATDESEFAPEIRCVAAPIRCGDEVMASIGVSAPTSRFSKSLYADYGEKARTVAARIGSALTQTTSPATRL